MRSPPFLLLFLAQIGCDAPPVEWASPVMLSAAPQSRLVVDSGARARFVADSSASLSVNAPGACPGSIKAAQGATQLRAVWWGVRADSSAVLFMAATPDSGKTWGAPVAVDTADVSVVGCRRPPPAVAAVG